MVQQEWFMHWDNAPVHTAAIVKNWLATRAIQALPHSSLFTEPRTRRLLVQESEGGAGWPSPYPGEPQECLGRCHEDHHQTGLPHRSQVVVWAVRTVRSDCWQLCQEKLENKHLPSYNHRHLIQKFRFGFDSTSYTVYYGIEQGARSYLWSRLSRVYIHTVLYMHFEI